MVLIDLNSLTVRDKIHILRKQLNRECLERSVNIDALIALFLSKQHGILLGPPGTGKTYLIELLCHALGGDFFSLLASATTKPDEVFGPVSIKSLKEDEIYKRNTKGKLPSATIAYMDEVFKADGDILNTLLKVINERVYHNPHAQKVPLRSMVASSNEVPTEDNTGAFVDRFVYKSWVNYIQDKDNWMILAKRKINGHQCQVTIELESWDVEQAEQEFLLVSIEPMLELLFQIKEKLKAKGFEVSDRKWFQMFDFFRAYAWVQDKTSVDLDTIETLLPDCIWSNPDDITAVTQCISELVKTLKNKPREIKKSLQLIADEWEAKKEFHKESRLTLAIDLCDRIEQANSQITELENIGIYPQKKIDELRADSSRCLFRLKEDCAVLNNSEAQRQNSLKEVQKWLNIAHEKYERYTKSIEDLSDKEVKIDRLLTTASEIAAAAKQIKNLSLYDFPGLTEQDKESALAKCKDLIINIQTQIESLK
jgi:MoxR-like ATPase